MKIVFDTSVLLSAFLSTDGLSSYVFKKSLKYHTVILSAYILEEAREKMAKKFNVPKGPLDSFLAFLRRRTVVLNPSLSRKISFSDKGDVPILQLVQFCQAHYFVTWDKKLLDLKKIGPSLILSPKEIVEIL
jgi:putative PIN family toxin of toxin-antitoxin system